MVMTNTLFKILFLTRLQKNLLYLSKTFLETWPLITRVRNMQGFSLTASFRKYTAGTLPAILYVVKGRGFVSKDDPLTLSLQIKMPS